MAETPHLKQLKDRVEAAMLKDKLKEAADLLAQLERAEATNPRWSHRLGDLQRRIGNNALSIAAYERAVDRYAKTGFIARAVAMAKTITGIDPSRTDVLARIQQDDARGLKARQKPTVSLVPMTAHALTPDVSRSAAPVPLPAPALEPESLTIPPAAPRQEVKSRPPQENQAAREVEHELAGTAAALTPAADAADDEIRFADQEDTEIAFDLSEEELEVLPAKAASVPPPVPEPDRAAKSLAVLPLFALFADVPREALLAMASASELIEVGADETLIRRGDPADSLYAIVEGSVRVIIPGLDQEARQPLREGEIFGEACLLTDEPRHADVVSAEPLTALRIPKATIDALVKAHAEVGSVLTGLLTRRLLVNLIKTSPVFAALDMDTRREVARLFEIRKATRGTVLVQAKKRGDGLYIPLTGKLEVTRADGSTHVLPAGTIVGQGTFLGHAASSHTVRTIGDTVMLRLASSRLMELVTQYPMVLEQLSAVAIDDALA